MLDPAGAGALRSRCLNTEEVATAPNAGRRFPVEVLTAEEMAALLEVLPKGRAGVRNAALIALMWRVGPRIAEALALEPKDLDLAHGAIAILRGKGAKRRTIGLDPVAAGYIERWLAVRAELGVGDDQPVFCTIARRQGGPGPTDQLLDGPGDAQALRPPRRDPQARTSPRAAAHMRARPRDGGRSGSADPGAARPCRLKDDPAVHRPWRRLPSSRRCMSANGQPSYFRPHRLRQSATVSQGEPGPALPATARSAIERGPSEPEPAASPGLTPASGQAHQRVLDVLAANGGRATQPQLARALGVTPGRVSQLVKELHAKGLIVQGGFYRDPRKRGASALVWRLAPPKAKFTPDLHDPRERATPIARRGYGRRRVLDVINGLEGRASQAQIARELGIGSATVGLHCRALEREGELSRAGLDKSTSNRGLAGLAARRPRDLNTSSPAATRCGSRCRDERHGPSRRAGRGGS